MHINAINEQVNSPIGHFHKINKLVHVDIVHATSDIEVLPLELVTLDWELTDAFDQHLGGRQNIN